MARKQGTHLHITEKFVTNTAGAGNDETLKTWGYGVSYYDPNGGSRTGVILEAGIENGQRVTIVNIADATETITFAVEGTSNVAGGAAVLVGENEQKQMVWNTSLSLWIPDAVVTVGDIPDDSITNAKLTNMTRGTIKVGGASDAPTDLDAKTDTQILVGDGTDISSVAVSGDVTLANTGAVTIAADSVENTMLSNMTRGTVKVGGASDAPTDLDAKTDTQILIGDGTDVNSVAVSGDVTVANTGAVTIANDAVTSAKLDATTIQYAEVTLTATEIVGADAGDLGHGSGAEIVATPGADNILEFVSAVLVYDYDTAAYTGGGDDLVVSQGSTAVSAAIAAADLVGDSADDIAYVNALSAADIKLTANSNLNLSSTAFTQPGTAAGVLRVKVAYRIHAAGLA